MSVCEHTAQLEANPWNVMIRTRFQFAAGTLLDATFHRADWIKVSKCFVDDLEALALHTD